MDPCLLLGLCLFKGKTNSQKASDSTCNQARAPEDAALKNLFGLLRYDTESQVL